jgi:hypothetical protein
VGEPLHGTGSYKDFMGAFEERVTALGAEERIPDWE